MCVKLKTAYLCAEEDCGAIFSPKDRAFTELEPVIRGCPACGSSTYWPLDRWLREPGQITLNDGDIGLVVADPENGTIIINTRNNGLQLIVPILEAAILKAQLGMAITEAIMREQKAAREAGGDGD